MADVPCMKKTLVSLAALFLLALPASAAAAPPLTATPDPIVAPTTTVGSSSEMFTVVLRNDETEAIFVQDFSLGGADAAEFGINAYTCGSVEPGEKCEFTLWFSPNSVGSKNATLNLTLYGLGTQEIALSGQAVPAELTWSPGSEDFGLQWVNRGDERYLQLENTGEASVFFSSLQISGPDSSNFWINDSSCWNFPGGVIEPGQSCWVRVYFQPYEMRPYEAELVATASGVEFGAALSGEGGQAELVPSSNPFDFGSAAVGGAGELRTIVLTNQGNLPGAFFIAVIAGGDSGSFELLEEDCSGFEPVGPGETCSAKVRFKPQGTGAKSARLAMFGEDDGGTMIMLQGEGLASQVGLSAAALSFGAQEAGSRGPAQTLLVENGGATAATVDRIVLSGLDPDQFLLAGDECSEETLAPGASCALRVRFAPDAAGPKAAKLRVVGGFGALSATLSGSGEPAAPSAPPQAASLAAPVHPPASAPAARSKGFARNATIHGPKLSRKARRASLKQKRAKAAAKKKSGKHKRAAARR